MTTLLTDRHMFMRNRLARKMAAEMRGATCAGTQTSKAPTLSGPSVTNHYSVQSISKEINCAEHEYMNISPPPNYRACYGPDNVFARVTIF